MEAVGRALVGLSAYLQLKKAEMHEYHLWNLKYQTTNILYVCPVQTNSQKST